MDLLLGLTKYKIIDNKDNNSEAVMTVPLIIAMKKNL